MKRRILSTLTALALALSLLPAAALAQEGGEQGNDQQLQQDGVSTGNSSSSVRWRHWG